MFNLICKIWTFLLKLVVSFVDAVREIIEVLLTSLVDIFSSLWDRTIGAGPGGLLALAALGALAWWLFTSSDDDEEGAARTYIYQQPGGDNDVPGR